MNKRTWLAILAVLILLLGCFAVAHAEILPPYGEGQIGLMAEILCEELTLRAEPSASSAAVKKLHYGDFLIVMEQSNGWAYCALGDAEESPRGWVNADYIAVDPARYRTEKSTPVYAWNDLSAPRVALLGRDTTVTILKTEGAWLLVSLRAAVGWIHP